MNETELKFNLTTNQTVSDLAELISQTPLDWDLLANLFKTVQFPQRRNPSKNLGGYISELHLEWVLRRFRSTTSKLSLGPIPRGARRERYIFYQTRIGYDIDKDGRPRFPFRSYAEYDGLVLADGLPLVIEIKMADSRSGRIKAPHRAHEGVNSAMTTERVNYLLDPLRAYYRRDDFGYMVVVPKNKASTKESPVRQQFVGRGGIIVPIPETLQEFKQHLLETAQKHHL